LNQDGIFTSDGCTVIHCTAWGNMNNGIRVADSCLVQENDCLGKEIGFTPAGMGIHAASQANRIQGNNVSGCFIGYQIDATGNFIAANCARSNTFNFLLNGGQTFGPDIVGTGPITTNNPWANFEY
jgi:nitrous oxidase accessory protein NosD